MSAPTLFETAFENRSLFSDHYLEERFSERDDVQALQEEADAAFGQLRDLYRRVASEVDIWNEDQTEDNFVRPVLKNVLGWARKVQPHVQKQGRKGRPDYALFTSDDRRTTAVERADGDETKVFNYADAVADAKYWGRPLDGPALDREREKRAEMRRNNPSFQIIDYVTITGVEWGILTNGARWRLYYEGAPSRLETYFEVNLPEIIRLAEGNEEDRDEARRAFRLFYALFRADAYRPTVEGEKFVDVIYAASNTYAETLEDELKERVFDHVFLELATGLYENHVRNNGAGDPEEVLDDVYRATLRLLYRLLFLLYAESRRLLPSDNPSYYDHSLTRLAQRAREEIAAGRTLSAKHTGFWEQLDALFETIDEGDPAFDVPAYNGGLFRRGSTENDFLDNHEIGQKYIAYALVNLTAVDPKSNPTGPSVDYTSLDVRQLGSIYEGLLEHRLVITDDDDLDLQTDEGERKETGSYYTPHYVVEYIVEETLGPIVDERIQQFEDAMEKIDEILGGRDPDDPGVQAKLDAHRQKALDAFLTVRVCDPAMGSGHFLVYAADYLAERFGQILGRYPDNNPVTQQLEEIRQSILDELARQGVDTEGLAEENRLRDTSLLKRLVMKRCIYGVDKNPMAVELAKLSLWLHSFTVGAPLSFLDHHLKVGNSLIGADFENVMEAAKEKLFHNILPQILSSTEFMRDVAFSSDATIGDVNESKKLFKSYRQTIQPYKRLFDIWTSRYFGNELATRLVQTHAPEIIESYQEEEYKLEGQQTEAMETAGNLEDRYDFFHWALEFPEVYFDLRRSERRSTPGFEAVIGNPPYVRMEQFKDLKGFLRSDYDIHAERTDLYGYFIEQALDLVADEQRMGFIISNKWMRASYGEPIRDLIEETATARQVIDFGDLPVFDATTYPLILIAETGRNGEADGISARIPHLDFDNLVDVVDEVGVPFTQEQLWEMGWALLGNPGFDVLTKIREDTVPLRGYVGSPPLMGVKSGLNDAFVIDQMKKDKLVKRDEKSREIIHPVRTGKDIRRYHLTDPGTYLIYTTRHTDIDEYPAVQEHLETYRSELEERAAIESWYELQQPQEAYEEKFKNSKIVYPDISKNARFCLDEANNFLRTKANFIPTHDAYLLAVLNSQITEFYLSSISVKYRGGYMSLKGQYVEDIPIREIEFTTDEDEREDHVEALIDTYEATRAEDADPGDNPVACAVVEHLSEEPERADVVHDLLAHLAYEMTDLKAERATYHLDVTDYIPAPSDDGGVTLHDAGRYQPASDVQNTLLADTTEEREKLRVGRLGAESDGDIVHVRATARFKPEGDRESWPDAVPDEAERDQWDYVETDPIPVCTLHDCTETEAGLVVHWLDALNDADSGFSSYRDNATKTNSLLKRIHDARFPDPSDEDIQNALRPFLQNAKEATELDRQIAFTDGLIDQVVYRLYGLSDEEIAVIEQ